VKKLPGIDKLYYLRDRLLLLEVGIRKLVRAAEIAGKKNNNNDSNVQS